MTVVNNDVLNTQNVPRVDIKFSYHACGMEGTGEVMDRLTSLTGGMTSQCTRASKHGVDSRVVTWVGGGGARGVKRGRRTPDFGW